MLDISTYYQEILRGLKQDGRGLRRYSIEEIQWLGEQFNQTLALGEWEKLEQIFCLMDHSAVDCPEWESILLPAFKSQLPEPLIIFNLNCCRKHIIQARFKRGRRLELPFLEVLRSLLHHSQPEIVEWTLRTIEECGSQGVFFLRDLDKIKPPPWRWFNPHQRAVRELIALLERRWSRFEKI